MSSQVIQSILGRSAAGPSAARACPANDAKTAAELMLREFQLPSGGDEFLRQVGRAAETETGSEDTDRRERAQASRPQSIYRLAAMSS